jgi:hypothetical protein
MARYEKTIKEMYITAAKTEGSDENTGRRTRTEPRKGEEDEAEEKRRGEEKATFQRKIRLH